MLRHRWDITPREAVALQRQLAGQVRTEPLTADVRVIAGADCAIVDGGRIVAAAVAFDAATLKPIAQARHEAELTFPYIPGLLSFREAPAVIEAVRSLGPVDLLMCDGAGVAHPRGFGLASHVGLWLGVPTIGVAKSRLCGEHREPGLRRGCRASLRLGGRVVGAVLRTRTGVRPLYVSVGSGLSLEGACRWVLRCATAARLPEPTRRADQLVRRLKASGVGGAA